MKKRIKVFAYILIAGLCFFFAARNGQLRDEIEQNKETSKVYSQYTSVNDKKTDEEEKIEQLKSELEKVKEELSEKNESIERERKVYEERISNLYQDFKQNSYLLNAIEEEKETFDILRLSTIYVNDRIYASFDKYYEIVPKNLSIESKLNIIADSLSEKFFGNNPIKVQEVKEIDGKKIAFINLIDKEGDRNWSRGYFQGSTGGLITSTQLASFLQPEYEGEWINGVKFLYEGKDIEFQHVPELNEIIYRKDRIDSVEQYFPSEESYDKNKDYLNESPNRDTILLKGPIKIGTTWNNGKRIITGINVLVETPRGAFNTVEVTDYGENYKSKTYFARDLGIVKRIYKYDDDMEIVEKLVECK